MSSKTVACLSRYIRETADELEPERGIDVIYTSLDELLRSKKFFICDQLLTEDFDDLPVVHVLAILSITEPARYVLTNRAGFARRLRKRLTREDPERVDNLLVGLE